MPQFLVEYVQIVP
jgi:serine/threonine protein kinase